MDSLIIIISVIAVLLIAFFIVRGLKRKYNDGGSSGGNTGGGTGGNTDPVPTSPVNATLHINGAITNGYIGGDGQEYLKFNLNNRLRTGVGVDDIEYEGNTTNNCVGGNPEEDKNRHQVIHYSTNKNGIKYDDFDYYDTDTNNWVGMSRLKITKVIIMDLATNTPTTVTTSGTVVNLANGDSVKVTFGCEPFDVK